MKITSVINQATTNARRAKKSAQSEKRKVNSLLRQLRELLERLSKFGKWLCSKLGLVSGIFGNFNYLITKLP